MFRVLLFCLVSTSLFAQQKIAVVDYDSVLQEHPLFDTIQILFDELNQELLGLLTAKEQELENLYEQVIEKTSSGCAGSSLPRREWEWDSVATLQQGLQELTLHMDSLLMNIEDSLVSIGVQAVDGAIQTVSMQEGIDYCIDKKGVLFIQTEQPKDITNLILQYYTQQNYALLLSKVQVIAECFNSKARMLKWDKKVCFYSSDDLKSSDE